MDPPKNMPKNVMMRKWLPQNDILAHPNVVLIISHGGMFSNLEAVAYGKPMLMIPFFGDQYRNAFRVAANGYGKYLYFKEITKDLLLANIREVIEDRRHSRKAKEISEVFNDNLVHPMDTAIYWIEYVCRHRGAKHLKSHAVNMSWFSYLLLDVILSTILAIISIGYFAYLLFSRLYRRKVVNINNKIKQT